MGVTAKRGDYLGNYRRVLTIPGVRRLLLIMFVARIPICAIEMVLTLHVVLRLGHGYAAAGMVGAAGTIGVSVGAPLMGRVTDRFGLRATVAVTTIGYGTYWLTAWTLPYSALLVLSFAGGLVALPVMTIGRQSLAALVPAEHRKAAYSLDSVSVELGFMVGPALGVLVATRVSTVAAVIALGCLIIVSGVCVYVLNPPIRAAHEENPLDLIRPPRRSWLDRRMFAVLVISCAAVFSLAGVEVAMVAALRASGQVGMTGVVTVVWCVASVTGGVIYGALRRTPRSMVLLLLLTGLAVPIGLAGDQWWALCLAMFPSGLMCAPTLAGTGEETSRLAPPAVRGEAMGLQSSAITLGAALGAPLVGLAVDRFGAGWGFAASGLGGLLIGSLALRGAFARRPPAAGDYQLAAGEGPAA